MYANGLGVEKDPETAYAWISAASMAGDRRGDYLIPALKELLTAQQVSAASQKAHNAPFKPDRQLPINSFAP
jgi:TPR repeat protein